MADAVAAFQDGFVDRLRTLLKRHPELENVDPEEARRLGADAAEHAVAPVVWAAAVGDRWDTQTASQFLGVTRQALHKRVVNGTVLGLVGRGTTWFPVWQFDRRARRVRPEAAQIIRAFGDALGGADPMVVASWAVSDQPELGTSPEEWLAADNEPARVVLAAQRAAEALAW